MNSLQQKLTTYDTYAFRLMIRCTSALELGRASRWVSHLGDGFLYLLVACLLAIFGGDQGERFLLAGLWAYALELPVYLVLKNLIKRDRPCDRLEGLNAFIVPSDKFSFPSGHAAAAFVFAGLIAAFYPDFTLPVYVLACLIGLSRVLLGVHYPTDILAGAVLGAAVVTLSLAVPLSAL